MTYIPSLNPSQNYEVIGSVESTSTSELPKIVANARIGQTLWNKISPSERVRMLERAYMGFLVKKESISQNIAKEIGMPIGQARDEVQYGLTYFRWYLDNAEQCLAPEITRENDTEIHTVYYEPRGVVVAIAPWNYPFSMFVWTCIQALLAGNSIIFKTSKECILTGKLIEEIMTQSGIPDGVWTEVYGSGELGDSLVQENIDFITFTGSTQVGRGLAQKALEKGIGCVMELGGSAPGIVLDDADIDKIIDTLYFLRYSNSGQMCDGLKRLIVHKDRYNEVVEKLSNIIRSKKIGNALEETIDMGPLVSENQLKHLQEQYNDAKILGATILVEGLIDCNLRGAYHVPVLFGNITREMKIWKEEVFGPILPIVPFETIEEAIELANDTPYGLGAYVFTENRRLFERIAHEIKSGMVQMNNLNYCIPESPFGGYKSSGIGREHGKWGFHEFCNIKVISIPK